MWMKYTGGHIFALNQVLEFPRAFMIMSKLCLLTLLDFQQLIIFFLLKKAVQCSLVVPNMALAVCLFFQENNLAWWFELSYQLVIWPDTATNIRKRLVWIGWIWSGISSDKLLPYYFVETYMCRCPSPTLLKCALYEFNITLKTDARYHTNL